MIRRILFVCTGNICRSPSAESVLRAVAEERGLDVRVDSAGTKDWNAGAPADSRATAALERRGFPATAGVARKFTPEDFEHFDLVVATNESNRLRLLRECPGHLQEKVRLLLQFAPDAGARDVPDPYGGSQAEFETALDLIEAGVRGLLDALATGTV